MDKRYTQVLILVFIALLALSLTACSSGKPADVDSVEEATVTPMPTEPSPTATMIPPTATPIPPTPTPVVITYYKNTDFPTGKFINGSMSLNFREDGSCLGTGSGWGVSCMYGINGNLFSEMTFQYPGETKVPATYTWSFDGTYLTFTLHGVDLVSHRNTVYSTRIYEYVGKASGWGDPASDEDKFPTGRFVREDGVQAFEFDEDGNWRFFDVDLEQPTLSGKYVTTGNLYTEMTHDNPDSPQVPVTYTWTYDGLNLTFELWGEDVIEYREGIYNQQTYILDGD